MTALRRLLHRFGWHWWSRWLDTNGWGYPSKLGIVFEERHCRVPGCEAEQRRVREA